MLSHEDLKRSRRLATGSSLAILMLIGALPTGIAQAQTWPDGKIAQVSYDSGCGCQSCAPACNSCNSCGNQNCNSCGCGPYADIVEGGTPGDGEMPIDMAPPSVADNGVSAALVSSAANANIGGYIDPAVVATRVRLRYDNAENANFPNRAGYMYPAPAGQGGKGPTITDDVDMEEFSVYLEYALSCRFSVFVNLPYRTLTGGGIGILGGPGGLNGGSEGFGDLQLGARYALVDCCGDWLTAQVRFTSPTGRETDAIGTGHSSLEVGLLAQRRYDRLTLFGEIQDWINLDSGDTVNGDAFGGNILRYGVGGGYYLWESCDTCCPSGLMGVVEVVGWSVLDGYATDFTGALIDAQGDTIVNGKYGLRYYRGQSTLYAGYGHNWTSDRWYSDIIRVEYTRTF